MGCGTYPSIANLGKATNKLTTLSIFPASSITHVHDNISFTIQGGPADDSAACSWSSSNDRVLAATAQGTFLANSPGNVTITATCAQQTATSTVVVLQSGYTAPITIKTGGRYSGRWESLDPTVPAVTIKTDEQVTIEDSVVTGPGNLIVADGGKIGLHLLIQNVIGIGEDPRIPNMARGSFLTASAGNSIDVNHCSMHGVSFGVFLRDSTTTYLNISNNIASDMDDRASDGNGGSLLYRPRLGHFVQIGGVKAISAATIAWNEVINTPGKASVEDIINIYNSSGESAANPLQIHDNYLQGAFSSGNSNYTGGGIITDGGSNDPQQADGFVDIYNNQVVQTANYGIGINSGHDIKVWNNRVVSCGKDKSGNWLATTWGNGYSLWNGYDTNQYYNNEIIANTGGLIRPTASGDPMRADIWTPALSIPLNNIVQNNQFLAGGISAPTQLDEQNERIAWDAKLSQNSQTLGTDANVQQ
jgi:hypothetical protein